MEEYEIIRTLGKGRFGVAKLVQKNGGQLCVDKQISLDGMNKLTRERTKSEAIVLSQQRHPCIVCYIDHYEENLLLHIIMQYYEEGDLAAYIRKHKQRFEEEKVVGWLLQLGLAVRYLHQRRILHRDIKSANIFVTSKGMLVLGDFGICRELNMTLGYAESFGGTLPNMSPEMIKEKPRYNNKSDMWSLGTVFYEIVTLEVPFPNINIGNFKETINKGPNMEHPCIAGYQPDIKVVLFYLMHKDYKTRYNAVKLLRQPLLVKRMETYLKDEATDAEFRNIIQTELNRRRAVGVPPRKHKNPTEYQPERAHWIRDPDAEKKIARDSAESSADDTFDDDKLDEIKAVDEEEEIFDDSDFSTCPEYFVIPPVTPKPSQVQAEPSTDNKNPPTMTVNSGKMNGKDTPDGELQRTAENKQEESRERTHLAKETLNGKKAEYSETQAGDQVHASLTSVLVGSADGIFKGLLLIVNAFILLVQLIYSVFRGSNSRGNTNRVDESTCNKKNK